MRTTHDLTAAGVCPAGDVLSSPSFLRHGYLLLFLPALFTAFPAFGQTTNEYRSAGNGNWNALTSWQRWDGDSWETPTSAEGVPDRFAEAITIRSPHIVAVTAGVTVDQVVVETGARVNVTNQSWTIRDGVGTDLIVNGTVDITTTLNSTGGPQVEVNGTIINRNNLTVSGSGSSLSFNAGSSYEHARDGGTIDNATWDPTSICLISGTEDTSPNGFNQAFGNFIWNSPLMEGNRNFNADGMSVEGDFDIISTGTGRLQLAANLLTVAGDFTQSNGAFRISGGSANRVIAVAGNFDLNGGTLLMTSGNGSGTIRVAGDFSHSGSAVTETGTNGNGFIIFNGTAPQTYTGSGTVVGNIDYTINSGATLLASGSMGNSQSLVTNDGTLSPGASPGTLMIEGDLSSSGTLNMEIEGTGAGQFDQIFVTGTATINGTLEADFGTFVPTNGNTFQLITASAFAGSPTLSVISPHSINATYDNTTGLLTIGTVLPIRLVFFTGERVRDAIELKWRTESEENNDYMIVERSGNAFHFEEIGRVYGAGTTTEIQDYSFTDEAPLPGANYYRLRQVDMDGREEIHPVIHVDFIEPSVSKSLKVYPNPAAEYIRAAWAAGQKGLAELRLFNSSGQLLSAHRTDGENGTYELPLEHLSTGMYVLQLTQGNKREVIRFVKK